MRVSTKGRYALRIMLDIAMHEGDTPVRVKNIASRQDISEKYLEQVISLLTKAGLLRSIRGPQGGYNLTRATKDYTVGDILRVTEGDLNLVPCLNGNEAACDRAMICSSIGFWKKLSSAISSVIDETTLADLIDEELATTGNDYVI